MQRLLRNNVSDTMLPDDNSASVVVMSAPVRKADLETFENQIGDEHRPVPLAVPAQMCTTVVAVELLNCTVSKLQFDEGTADVAEEVGRLASVQDVSRAFGLNKEQHAAFVHIAVPLLHKIAGTAIPAQ
jgi:hypothetical protein